MPAVESRVSTRALLRQMGHRNRSSINLSGSKLNQREVGAFAVNALKMMWLASDRAELKKLKELLEAAFIEAYLVAGGVYDVATRKRLDTL